jgi:hypothetical protein
MIIIGVVTGLIIIGIVHIIHTILFIHTKEIQNAL